PLSPPSAATRKRRYLEMRRGHERLPGIHLELSFLLAFAGQDGSALALSRLGAWPRLVAAASHRHDGHYVRGLSVCFRSDVENLCASGVYWLHLLGIFRRRGGSRLRLYLPG